MEEELIKLGHLKRIDYQPGDKFVLMTPGPVSVETAEQLKRHWEKFMPGAEVAVLCDGLEVGILRPKKDAA
jgi:hypothetical protein